MQSPRISSIVIQLLGNVLDQLIPVVIKIPMVLPYCAILHHPHLAALLIRTQPAQQLRVMADIYIFKCLASSFGDFVVRW
jgi:hypothetical protein